MGEVVLASSGMTIKAGGAFELPIQVDRPSVLRIRFEVDEGYDVDFSLKFVEDSPNSTLQTVRGAARRVSLAGLADEAHACQRPMGQGSDSTRGKRAHGVCAGAATRATAREAARARAPGSRRALGA
jgi:hypothetical protein